MLILGLCGSLRQASHNRKLLRAAGRELPDDVEFQVYERLAELPGYSEDLTPPEPVAVLRRAIATADAVLIATPEYNSSIPGLLKNALDWASRPWPDNCLRGKPAAVIGTSLGRYGAVWAQAETRHVLDAIGARVIEEELPVGQVESAFDSDGRLRDPDLRAQLTGLLGELLAMAADTGQAA
jgi:chromate reductase